MTSPLRPRAQVPETEDEPHTEPSPGSPGKHWDHSEDIRPKTKSGWEFSNWHRKRNSANGTFSSKEDNKLVKIMEIHYRKWKESKLLNC